MSENEELEKLRANEKKMYNAAIYAKFLLDFAEFKNKVAEVINLGEIAIRNNTMASYNDAVNAYDNLMTEAERARNSCKIVLRAMEIEQNHLIKYVDSTEPFC
jgi:hypothetical protein